MASIPIRLRPPPRSTQPVRLVPPGDGAAPGDNDGIWKQTFTMRMKVPSSGIRYFELDYVPTSSSPIVVDRPGSLVGITLFVPQVDNNRDYKFSVKRNDTEETSISLLMGQSKRSATGISVSYTTQDEFKFSMEKTTGTGSSTFLEARAVLTFQDD